MSSAVLRNVHSAKFLVFASSSNFFWMRCMLLSLYSTMCISVNNSSGSLDKDSAAPYS